MISTNSRVNGLSLSSRPSSAMASSLRRFATDLLTALTVAFLMGLAWVL